MRVRGNSLRSVEVWRVGGLQGVGWRGVGRAAGQQSGSSLVAERVFFDRAVGWSGVCAGALLLLPAARMFVLRRVVSNTNSYFCVFALLSRCYTINICSSYRLYNANKWQNKNTQGYGYQYAGRPCLVFQYPVSRGWSVTLDLPPRVALSCDPLSCVRIN